MKVFCPVLLSGKYIATKNASTRVPGGHGISLPVTWGEVPNETGSFALTMIDQKSAARPVLHWAVINMSPSLRGLSEGASRAHDHLPVGTIELRNSYGELGYTGPDLPLGASAHEYVITVYSLREMLEVGPYASYEQLSHEVQVNGLASASLVALFQR